MSVSERTCIVKNLFVLSCNLQATLTARYYLKQHVCLAARMH